MDISKFFDTIDHELLMKGIEKHIKEKWILLYIKRWIKVPYVKADGEQIERREGVPQGSVIGPLLANLFLHYVFDTWMTMKYPSIPFERYADDTICHCKTVKEAEGLRLSVRARDKKHGVSFTVFLPAISKKSAQKVRKHSAYYMLTEI